MTMFWQNYKIPYSGNSKGWFLVSGRKVMMIENDLIERSLVGSWKENNDRYIEKGKHMLMIHHIISDWTSVVGAMPNWR